MIDQLLILCGEAAMSLSSNPFEKINLLELGSNLEGIYSNLTKGELADFKDDYNYKVLLLNELVKKKSKYQPILNRMYSWLERGMPDPIGIMSALHVCFFSREVALSQEDIKNLLLCVLTSEKGTQTNMFYCLFRYQDMNMEQFARLVNVLLRQLPLTVVIQICAETSKICEKVDPMIAKSIKNSSWQSDNIKLVQKFISTITDKRELLDLANVMWENIKYVPQTLISAISEKVIDELTYKKELLDFKNKLCQSVETVPEDLILKIDERIKKVLEEQAKQAIRKRASDHFWLWAQPVRDEKESHSPVSPINKKSIELM